MLSADEAGRMNNFSEESIILVCVCIVYVHLLMWVQVCVCGGRVYMYVSVYVYVCILAYVWRWEDSLRYGSSPYTLFKTVSLLMLGTSG